MPKGKLLVLVFPHLVKPRLGVALLVLVIFCLLVVLVLSTLLEYPRLSPFLPIGDHALNDSAPHLSFDRPCQTADCLNRWYF
jgi:hypothetical protein